MNANVKNYLFNTALAQSILLFITAATAAFITPTFFCVWTTYTCLTSFFRLIDVDGSTSNYTRKNYNKNQIFHSYQFISSEYSFLSLLLLFKIIQTTIPTITANAARPGKKPAPSLSVVISVPI